MRRKRRVESEVKLEETTMNIQSERCMNPWNGECKNTDIAVFIYHEGRRLPICRDCWFRIASTDIEWSCD
ncbi:TPA: hypothetical protein EYP70_07790 [Candidatus Bathyarchaeota archaeon]|nr:hypothetical protein [Candidatus Bathyarchaeota archaeon]